MIPSSGYPPSLLPFFLKAQDLHHIGKESVLVRQLNIRIAKNSLNVTVFKLLLQGRFSQTVLPIRELLEVEDASIFFHLLTCEDNGCRILR
ncbi:hypothetical protein NPIL_355341 [Nephila pilipes]|uniref:Uncharacterized protein n=1 Tax=Nephila pilipes TaxID=299642 RepID=A0A8X6QMI7_NEPPI|nr:hypothetical protein NPIL_355341 [Nephila pilipes]